MFSYNLERAGGKFTVTPAGYILVNDKIDRETEDVHSFQVSHMKLLSNSFYHETLDLSIVTVPKSSSIDGIALLKSFHLNGLPT